MLHTTSLRSACPRPRPPSIPPYKFKSPSPSSSCGSFSEQDDLREHLENARARCPSRSITCTREITRQEGGNPPKRCLKSHRPPSSSGPRKWVNFSTELVVIGDENTAMIDLFELKKVKSWALEFSEGRAIKDESNGDIAMK